MTILVVMIPISILLMVAAGILFFWAVDHDQFDDMDTPALLPLMDEDPPRPKPETTTGNDPVGKAGGGEAGGEDAP